MKIEFDAAKREATLRERGLDMAGAGDIFDSETITIPDIRKDYGEPRSITIGFLSGRMVVVVWTARGRTPDHFTEESQ